MMLQGTVQNGLHFWNEINTATAPGVPTMDFRAMLNPALKVNMHSSSVKEPPTDTIGEDFLLDDLTEFSSEDIAGPIVAPTAQLSYAQSNNSSMTNLSETGSSIPTLERSLNAGTCKDDVFYPPCNDMAELDWFSALDEEPFIYGASNFCEDSFLINNDHHKAIYGSGMDHIAYDARNQNFFSTERAASQYGILGDSSSKEARGFTLETPVPGRARSKRSRSGGRVWSSGMFSNSNSPPDGVNSTTEEPSSITISSQHFCHSETESTLEDEGMEDLSGIEGSPLRHGMYSVFYSKKAWKASNWRTGMDNIQARRCAHCLIQKTPQWRAGPTGPKTLCNACGVRFKSGRLFPEYRPAKSPTFVSQKHSNSHKKVMEMRRQKTVGVLQKQGKELKVRLRLNSEMDESNLIDIMPSGRGAGGVGANLLMM